MIGAACISKNLSGGFYAKFGGRKVVDMVLMTECMSFAMKAHLTNQG